MHRWIGTERGYAANLADLLAAHPGTCPDYKATINADRDRCVLRPGHDGYHEAAAKDGMRPWWRHSDGTVHPGT